MKCADKKAILSVRIPKELNRNFDELVATLGVSKSAFILTLINREINKFNKKKKKEDTA